MDGKLKFKKLKKDASRFNCCSVTTLSQLITACYVLDNCSGCTDYRVMTTDYENSHTATLLYHHRAETAGEELSSGRFLSAPRQQRQSERLGELQHSSGEKLFDCKLGSARLGSVHTLYRSCIISVASCLFVCCSYSPPPLLRVHITSSA